MPSDTLDDDERRRIEQFVTDWLADERIPGASVAVVRDGETAYAEGFGARDLANNEPATAETAYGVASVTKSFTALAVLQQVQRGAVELHEPVSAYLDWFDELAEPPTVHELLAHASGMPSDGASVALIARLTEAAPVEVPLSSADDLRRYVDGSTAERADGDRFFYYNTGYTALGTLIERVDGRSFPTYADDEILRPLGMSRATIAPSAFGEWDDAMTPYRPGDDRVPCELPVKGVGAAGGLAAPVTELAEYLRFQLDPDPSVIDPELLATAHEAHSTRQTYADGDTQTYGYGWMRRSLFGERLIEHGGSLGVSTAYVGMLPDSATAVVVACNDSPEAHPQYVGPAVLARLRGKPATATRFYRLRDRTTRLAGEYDSYNDIMTASVEPAAGSLRVTFTTALGDQQLTAHPVSTDDDSLRYETTAASGARVPLVFEPTDDGYDLFYRRWRLHPA